MNAVTNVDAVLDNGAEFSIKGMTLNTTNNLRERKEVGTLGALSIGAGSISVTGTINVFYGAAATAIYAGAAAVARQPALPTQPVVEEPVVEAVSEVVAAAEPEERGAEV